MYLEKKQMLPIYIVICLLFIRIIFECLLRDWQDEDHAARTCSR